MADHESVNGLFTVGNPAFDFFISFFLSMSLGVTGLDCHHLSNPIYTRLMLHFAGGPRMGFMKTMLLCLSPSPPFLSPTVSYTLTCA